MKYVSILLAIVVVFLICITEATISQEEKSSRQVATDADNDDDNYYDDDDYDYSIQDKKGLIKHKHKNKLFFFYGGLKSLAAFIAIKIKIILIVITVIGVIGFTLKVFGALKYAGYIGGSDCPVIHEPAYGLGYSATPPSSHDHIEEYGSYGPSNNDWSSTGTWARNLVENYIDTDIFSHALKNMDIAEMIFSSLEMEDDQCRRRLVCEIDFQTRQLPLLNYVMKFFSHGFEKYRTSSNKTMKFSECAKMYSECEDEKKSRKRRKKSVEKYRYKNYYRTRTLMF